MLAHGSDSAASAGRCASSHPQRCDACLCGNDISARLTRCRFATAAKINSAFFRATVECPMEATDYHHRGHKGFATSRSRGMRILSPAGRFGRLRLPPGCRPSRPLTARRLSDDRCASGADRLARRRSKQAVDFRGRFRSTKGVPLKFTAPRSADQFQLLFRFDTLRNRRHA